MKAEILGHTVTLNPMTLVGVVRYWWDNRRSARGTIRKLVERGIEPKTLVDMGAHGSEWMQYLSLRWPLAVLHSYEPNPTCYPLGIVHRYACGAHQGTVRMNDTVSEETHASADGRLEARVVRFEDDLTRVESPALLKVDCENMTWEALEGCGVRLSAFEAVHVEMMNYELNGQYVNQQANIWCTMLKAGFTFGHVVDCAVWPNNVAYYDILFLKR